LKERHIREIRKRFTSTSRADLAVMLLGMLWTHAKEVLAMDLGVNPSTEIQRLHRRGWSHEPWPESVIAAEARPKPNAQLALLLRLYTGQRASDVVRMRWSDYDGSSIPVRQLKTGGAPDSLPFKAKGGARPRAASVGIHFDEPRRLSGTPTTAIRRNVPTGQ
jgi:integrase